LISKKANGSRCSQILKLFASYKVILDKSVVLNIVQLEILGIFAIEMD